MSENAHLQMFDSEFPMSEDGRTYHLQVKKGEVTNRIILVGDLGRAKKFSQYLDSDTELIVVNSSRGFLTFTGKFKGIFVSIIGTGMGTAMIDFTIREVRAVVDGPMYFIRIGTCGTPQDNISLGDVVIQSSAYFIRRNPDAFRIKENKESNQQEPYLFSLPVNADEKLVSLLKASVLAKVDSTKVHVGVGATCCSFYSSQGRFSKGFDDRNGDLIDKKLSSHYKDTVAIEMETFHLFDLCDCSQNMHAASMCLVLAQRKTHEFVNMVLKEKREAELGVIGLETIIAIE